MMSSATQLLTHALVDDAGLFPPASLDLGPALARHQRDRREANAVLSHRFVCPVSRLDELRSCLSAGDQIDVIALGSPDQALFEVIGRTLDDGRTRVVAVETALPAERDAWPDALAGIERLAGQLPSCVEVPLGPAMVDGVCELAQRGLAAKIRCGGLRVDLFPTAAELAGFLLEAARARLAFKATAGLHHAVGYRDPVTGFDHYGFVNLLVAVHQALGGADLAQLAQTLRSRVPAELLREIGRMSLPDAERVRRCFLSIGSCDTTDPLEDLADLGLLGDVSAPGPAVRSTR